jgi:hypothetical protein
MARKPSVKSNGQRPAPATDTNAPTERVDYYKAVVEGREILAQIDKAERGYYRLGELVYEVMEAAPHGDRTLSKYAEDLDVAKCTLDRYLNTFRSWKGILAPGPKMPSYSVLRELAPHASDPECQKAIRENPDISKRKALDLKRKLKGTEEKQEQETKAAQEAEWLRHNRKWFKDIVTLANEATSAAAFAHNECTTDEQWRRLLEAVEPGQLMYLNQGGRMLVKLADLLERLLEEPETVDLAERVAQWDRADDEHRAKASATTEEAATVQAF